MIDRPIIFSAPMVRALLDGRKTQTRRLLYKKTKNVNSARLMAGHPTPRGRLGEDGLPSDISVDQCWTLSGWQKVKPGDRLWVREAFTQVGTMDPPWLVTKADCTPETIEEAGYRWRPSIHMPRWASRITLIVTGVKIGRLQEISAEDAEAEGCRYLYDGPGAGFWIVDGAPMECCSEGAVECFSRLWEAVNGERAWSANPFVVAITFRVVRGNIDQVLS